MMWNYIKRGFGYGLGGRIGWELGGLIWGMLRKLIVWIKKYEQQARAEKEVDHAEGH